MWSSRAALSPMTMKWWSSIPFRAAGTVHSNITTLDFRKADFVPLEVLLLAEDHGIKNRREEEIKKTG